MRILDLQTQKVSTLCGSGLVGEPGHIDGPCVKSKLNFPQKIALEITNEKRMLYITELNDCIRVVDLVKKEIFTLCGGLKSKNGLKDGDGKDALMNFPYGIAQIETGKKFAITESDNHSLRILDL